MGGCKPFSLRSVTKKRGGGGLDTSALRNAPEKIHSSKTEFFCILYNFRSADWAPKANIDNIFGVTLIFLHSNSSELHKNDLQVRDFKVLQVCDQVIQCAAKILIIR